MLVNSPLAYTAEPLSTRARTPLLALGLHPVATPVVASSAAIRSRACPPMLVKGPPAETVDPPTATARTSPWGFGFQAETERSEAKCAMFVRGKPPTVVNWPPIYQPPAPSETTADKEPRTFGKDGGSAPLAISRETPPPLAGPT